MRTIVDSDGNESAESEAELVATVAYMVNSGRVRLCGNFRGARFDLDALSLPIASAARAA